MLRHRWLVGMGLVLVGGVALVAPSPPAQAQAPRSTVTCEGTTLRVSTPGAQLSFGSYQLFGTGPNLTPAPNPNDPSQNQGLAYAQDGTVTVTGPNNPNV